MSTITLTHGMEITSGVMQGSILDPLLQMIFVFVEHSDLRNYADYNTLCSSGNDLEQVKQILRQGFEMVLQELYGF